MKIISLKAFFFTNIFISPKNPYNLFGYSTAFVELKEKIPLFGHSH